MKNNKLNIILGFSLILFATIMYSVIPNFQTEDFDQNIIEDISLGSTTTSLIQDEELEIVTPTPEIIEEEIIIESTSVLEFNETIRIDDIFTTYLIIGSDKRTENSSESRGFVQGERADVLILGIVDKDNIISLVSLPRDLLIENPCTGKLERINSAYKKNDCGNAPENLSAVILNLTGLKIEHFAKFNFEGFEEIIDSLGGIEICVDSTQREGFSFELQKGCQTVRGEIALNWVVSRNTEVLVGDKIVDKDGNDNSTWEKMSGVSDLTRIKKEQYILTSLLSEVKNFGNLNSLFKFIDALENTFVVDENLTTNNAARLLWNFRNFNFDEIKTLTVPTKNYVTESNAQVLILTSNFYDFLKSESVIGR